MTLPHTFEPGTIAASSEVNENFDHIMGLVGSDSTSDRLAPDAKDIVLGPRDATQITAMGDVGPGAPKGFLQMSWNAELYDSGGGTLKYRRFIPNEGAMAATIGNQGFSLLGTGDTTGDLEEKMETAVRAYPDPFRPWIYINERWRLRRSTDAIPVGNIGSFRNTLVFLDPPCELIPQFSAMEPGTITKDVRTLPPGSIPREATALLIHAWFEMPNPGSGIVVTTLKFTPMADGNNADYMQSGFQIATSYQSGNNDTFRRRAEGQGIVRVGRVGNYEPFIKVTLEFDRSPAPVTIGAWVQGYFV